MNKNILTCVIIDDEPLAQDLLEKFVMLVPSLQLLAKCNNAVEAMDCIYTRRPDFVFLDIHMPEISGIELMRSFTASKPFVIFTTAHTKYASEGFEYDAVDYLIKPVPFERFLKAINKLKERIELLSLRGGFQTFAPNPPLPQAAAKEPLIQVAPADQDYYCWIKQDKKLVQVNTEEIILVEAMKDYIKIYLKDNQMLVTHMTMLTVENLLPKAFFLRINRSFIIRKNAIKSVNGNIIEMYINRQIAIGVTYREKIKDTIKEWITNG